MATILPSGAGLPPFVDCPSPQTLPGPVQFLNVTMTSFILRADLSKLQDLCTKLIERPSGGAVRFKPLLPYVIMSFTDLPHGFFVNFANQGIASERELALGIPGMYEVVQGSAVVERSLGLVMPFLFLDNPVALMTGRENFGYFKQHGAIRLPSDPGSNGFSAEVYGCQSFHTKAHWGPACLTTLARTGVVPAVADAALEAKLGLSWAETVAAALGARDALLTPDNLAAGRVTPVIADFLVPKLPQIFLKQFRDIADGRRACYQAVTQSKYTLTSIPIIVVESNHSFHLTPLDSTPIAEALGLAPATETGLGVRISMDMRLENGRVLWQA